MNLSNNLIQCKIKLFCLYLSPKVVPKEEWSPGESMILY